MTSSCRSLEKEPDRRYQHASDVKTEVESIARGTVPSPRIDSARHRLLCARTIWMKPGARSVGRR